jgi:hypothetical protein
MRKFKLLKDTVKSKAGIEFEQKYDSVRVKYYGNKENTELFLPNQIENNPEWFEEVFDNEYTWEKCFDGNGFIIYHDSRLIKSSQLTSVNQNHNVFKHLHQAKSSLAKAQLSHIIAVANENSDGSVEVQNGYNGFVIDFNTRMNKIDFYNSPSFKKFLWFKSEEIARKVYEQNKQLIHDYLEIEL